MPNIRTIGKDEALDTVWEELVYTEARLLKDPHAKHLAQGVTEQLDRWELVAAGQRKAWRAEIVAQAGVDSENDQLDMLTEDFGQSLRHVERGDVQSHRFKKVYFKGTVSGIKRLALQSQLAASRTWPESLKGEPEKELRAFSPRFEARIAAGDAAVEERAGAATHTANHRVRQIVPFIEDLNAARQSLYGTLIGVGQEHKLGSDWPGGFFRRVGKQPKTTPVAEGQPGGGGGEPGKPG
jgi:hypothetical protein